MRTAVLVVVLAACTGDGVRHTPDATVHDGPVTPDAPVDGLTGTPVTITTTVDGAPVVGVHVYFQNADSTLVAEKQTDATGTASAVMLAGGYVTAINPYTGGAVGAQNELDTFAGVQPGDHLVLPLHSTATSITVTVIADLDPASATEYAYSPCGSGQLMQLAVTGSAIALAPPRGTFSLSNCGATSDFLIVSYDQSGTPLNFFYAPAVAVSDQAMIDLTGMAFAGVPTRDYNYTNAGTSGLSFDDHLLATNGSIYTITGNAFPTTTMLIPAFTGANDLVVTRDTETRDIQTFADWGPYATPYTTDVGARLLAALQSSPSFDPTAHTMSWTEAATGVTPDFAFASIYAARTADSRSWTWRIAAPHATTLTYPTLPTDLYDFNITANDGPGNPQLTLGKVPGGWDAVRPYALASVGNPQAEQFVTGTTGSATIEQYALLVRGSQRRGDSMGHGAPSSRAAVRSHRVQ